MSLSKFTKALAVGSVIMIFVGVDTCANQSFRPKVKVKTPKIDTTKFNIEGMNYIILQNQSGDIEVLNVTMGKKIVKNLVD